VSARDYIAFGLKLVPLIPRGKEPIVRLAPHGWESATDDPASLTDWPPDAGTGIACLPSGLVVLDVDPRRDADDQLHDLERELGRLPDSWRSITGGGGEHLYYADPDTALVGKLGEIEVKSRGYVVAPPSVHSDTGRQYEWDLGPGDVALAVLPAPWVARLARPALDATPGERADDALLNIPPAVYAVALAGERHAPTDVIRGDARPAWRFVRSTTTAERQTCICSMTRPAVGSATPASVVQAGGGSSRSSSP